MQDRWNNSFEHFFLSKGHQQHVFQSLIFMIIDDARLAKLDVAFDSYHPLADDVCGYGEDD
ncbi:MAG: hypothetical protein WDN75_05795 [Bacteroidota bacterium]